MTPAARNRFWIVASSVGFLIALYLTLIHYTTRVPLVCSATGVIDCARVLSSPYATVAGLPVAVYGLAWFAVALVLAVWSLKGGSLWVDHAMLGWVLAGSAVVLYLVYVELGVVGKICAWCSGVHLIVLSLLVTRVIGEEG